MVFKRILDFFKSIFRYIDAKVKIHNGEKICEKKQRKEESPQEKKERNRKRAYEVEGFKEDCGETGSSSSWKTPYEKGKERLLSISETAFWI